MTTSKQKVLDAASQLFYQKGFHGSSVRDIAERANVNVSLISYYFKNKQGLLEYAVTSYYEVYLEKLEEIISHHETSTYLQQLKKLIEAIIQYKQDNHQMTCFIQRELTIDSVFFREMAVTYLAKENHLLQEKFYAVTSNRKELDRSFLFMQLKGMLLTPYVLDHEWKHKVVGEDANRFFVDQYVKKINEWLDHLTTSI